MATDRAPVWLLDVDLGGGVLHYATARTVVPSLAAGGDRVYLPGLPDLRAEAGGEGVRVTLPVDAAPYVARHGRLRGRPWVLRLWRGEPYLEHAETVARGVIGGSAWGAPGGPSSLDLDLVRPAEETTATLLGPGSVVDGATWPNATEGGVGEVMPLVLGRPGSTAPIGRYDVDAYPASPAILVDDSFATRTFVIAGHHVAATTVSVWDLTDEAALVSSSVSVLNTTDFLSQPCAVIAILHATLAVDRDKVFVGWTGGGGILDAGAELRGLGSVLLWGALRYGGGVYDLARIAAQRDDLDLLLVDAVWNDPEATWAEWVASVEEVLGLERVDGPSGTWWARGVWVPDPSAVRATLSADADGGGLGVSRVTPYTEDDAEELAGEVTVYYAQHGEVRWPRRVTYAAETGRDDARTVQHPALKRTAELGGGTARVVYAPTADPATAWAIAGSQVDRYGVPAAVAEFAGGPEVGARLRRGHTVEVVEGGVVSLAVVRAVVLGERDTVVRLRFPLA